MQRHALHISEEERLQQVDPGVAWDDTALDALELSALGLGDAAGPTAPLAPNGVGPNRHKALGQRPTRVSALQSAHRWTPWSSARWAWAADPRRPTQLTAEARTWLEALRQRCMSPSALCGTRPWPAKRGPVHRLGQADPLLALRGSRKAGMLLQGCLRAQRKPWLMVVRTCMMHTRRLRTAAAQVRRHPRALRLPWYACLLPCAQAARPASLRACHAVKL